MIDPRLNNLVSEALINAHEGGFTFEDVTLLEIAEDIVDHFSDLNEEDPAVLVPYIKSWFTETGHKYNPV